MSYTRINRNGFKNIDVSYNGMCISATTANQRNQLKHGIDDFTSFTWRGVDAWDTFGAFIINNKNTLKFYNGPSYSNEYTKPQFESAAGQLTGINFQIQKIDFTIGVYWINEHDYRQLINWLNPYEINTLTFGFEDHYYYQVKLASVADGIRYVVGKEYKINYTTTIGTINEDITANIAQYIESYPGNVKYIGNTSQYNNKTYRKDHVYSMGIDLGRAIDEEYEYYTEIKLTFEIQGAPCAYNKIPYTFNRLTSFTQEDWSYHPEHENGYGICCFEYDSNNIVKESDLETPLKLIIDIDTSKIVSLLSVSEKYLLTLESYAQYDSGYYDDTHTWISDWHEVTLFSISLQNLSYLINDPNWLIQSHLQLEYDSESGLIFLLNGDSEYCLLNTLTTASQGEKILNHMIVNKYSMTGKLNYYNFDISKLRFTIYAKITANDSTVTVGDTPDAIFGTQNPDDKKTMLIMRGRTNLI